MDSSNSNYTLAIIYSHQSALKYVECRQLLRSFILCAYARRDCVGLRRFESRLTTYKMLALNSTRPTFFVADMVIPFGRYGLFVWPMWSWPIWFVADIVVADMVCGRYGTDPPAVPVRLASVTFVYCVETGNKIIWPYYYGMQIGNRYQAFKWHHFQ